MTQRRSIGMVSFNRNESDAVDALLTDLATGLSPWSRKGPNAIERPYAAETWRLEHFPLLAQGNVVAAAQLAEFFADRAKAPDYVVFYGCAGALDRATAESVFLVRDVNYVSLGTVTDGGNGSERVTLKNKWLCHVTPEDEGKPLNVVGFPLCMSRGQGLNLCGLTGITPARVAATDKVIRVRPAGAAPPVYQGGPPHNLFTRAEWTYGEALAHVSSETTRVIVEMESYGIGRIAQALKIEDRVVVLRVTTDALTDHSTSDDAQWHLLQRGRHVLGVILLALLYPGALRFA